MRIQAGVRLVVPGADRWYDAVRAGNAFVGRGTQSGVAAQNSHVQLFNPVASGVNAILHSLPFSKQTAGTISFTQYNTALATLVTQGINLLSGNAAGLCAVRRTTNVGILGTVLEDMDVAAVLTVFQSETWYMEIGPGEGIVMANNTLNDSMTGNFRWIELTI